MITRTQLGKSRRSGHLYVEADIERIRKKGLIVFQGEDATPNTGLVLVIRNPKGRLGRPYRNLNDSWNNLMTMMLERHASNANPFMFRRLMLKYMLDRSIMTDANDGSGYFAFFAKSVISKKEWNSFLASLDENALANIAKNGVRSKSGPALVCQSLCSSLWTASSRQLLGFENRSSFFQFCPCGTFSVPPG